jgi:hypothetical protein
MDEEMTAIFDMILKEQLSSIDVSSIDVICGDCSSMVFPVLSKGLSVESHLRMLSLWAAILSGHAVLIGEILESESKCAPAGVMTTGLNNSFEESSFCAASNSDDDELLMSPTKTVNGLSVSMTQSPTALALLLQKEHADFL